MRKGTKRAKKKFTHLKQYFLRGHTQWFALGMSLFNFTLIFFNFGWVKIPFVPNELKNEMIFFVVFGLLYFPLATAFGWWDFKKGTYEDEVELLKDINPIYKGIFKRLKKLEQQNKELKNDLKEIKEILLGS